MSRPIYEFRFRQCINDYRAAHHLSLDQFADWLGKSKWTVYKWFRAACPNRKVAKAVCLKLGADPDFVLDAKREFDYVVGDKILNLDNFCDFFKRYASINDVAGQFRMLLFSASAIYHALICDGMPVSLYSDSLLKCKISFLSGAVERWSLEFKGKEGIGPVMRLFDSQAAPVTPDWDIVNLDNLERLRRALKKAK